MSHRINIYNTNDDSSQSSAHCIAQWNYVVPVLMLPLFGANLHRKDTILYADRQPGIVLLKRFYHFLNTHYNLEHHAEFHANSQKLFSFLEALAFDKFQIDPSDVFLMQDQTDIRQAEQMLIELNEQIRSIEKAIQTQDFEQLSSVLQHYNQTSFLDILQQDTVAYGLGYWSDFSHTNLITTFTKNGFYGLQSNQNKSILPPIYHYISSFEDNLAQIVDTNQNIGCINAQAQFIIPCSYQYMQWPFDTVYPKAQLPLKVSVVAKDNMYGLLCIEQNKVLLPLIYQAITPLHPPYYSAKTKEVYHLLNCLTSGDVIISSQSDLYLHQPTSLVYSQSKTNSKSSFYTLQGDFVGEFYPDQLKGLSNHYYYAKAFKPNKDITLFCPKATVIDQHIQQIITLENYQSIAYHKANQWYIYNTITGQYVLENEAITQVQTSNLPLFFNDYYCLLSPKGKGVYDALSQQWIVVPNQNYTHIDALHYNLLKIVSHQQSWLFDTAKQKWSQGYTHISGVINQGEILYLLFQENQLFYADQHNEIQTICAEQIGQLLVELHSLSQVDQNYFHLYYNHWKREVGPNYLNLFDSQTLYTYALDLLDLQEISKAKAVLELGLERNHPQMITELAILANQEHPPYTDLTRAIELYHKAADLNCEIACNNLAVMYQDGHAVAQNIPLAIKFYLQGGQLGNALGYQNAANLYFYGQEVETDYDKALSYYLLAQELGCDCQEQLTEIYFSKAQYQQVLQLLKDDVHNSYSPIYYGIMYEQGLGGLTIDVTKSISYYKMALKLNVYPYALERLLQYYKPSSPNHDLKQWNKYSAYARENDLENMCNLE